MACYAFDMGTGKVIPLSKPERKDPTPEKLFKAPIFKTVEKVEVVFAMPLGQTEAISKVSAAVATLGGKVEYVSDYREVSTQDMMVSLPNLVALGSLLKRYPDLGKVMERINTGGAGNCAVLGALLVNPEKIVRA